MRLLEIVIVDDDAAVLDALTATFQAEGFRVRAYSDSDTFLADAQRVRPDCLLLDVHMPSGSGLEVLRAVGGAGYPAPVIMITGQGDIPTAVGAVKAGAHDFIEKPFDGQEVIARVRKAMQSFSLLSDGIGHSPAGPPAGAETLTPREREVLEQIVRGSANKEAGRRLGISPRTVEVHRARIMEKLGARNTADLMRIILS